MRKCLTIDLEYILKHTAKDIQELDFLVEDDDGKPLKGIQLYNLAIEAKKKGYKVLPMCDNIDEQGRCKGHEIKVVTPVNKKSWDYGFKYEVRKIKSRRYCQNPTRFD